MKIRDSGSFMKINELARLSHVNAETIRMYRNKGLLLPRQNENGYYEYSPDDLQTLLFIRKLRGMNLSLPTVAYTYRHTEVEDVLACFQREYDALEAQIAELQRRQAMLRLHMDHYDAYRESCLGVSEVEIPEDRYDLILDRQELDEDLDCWLAHVDHFTQGLYFPGELLNGPELPERIPVRLTLGSYLPILREYEYPIPDRALCFPRGTYLAAKVVLDGERELTASQLQPLADYAREHCYRFVGGATAFLFRVDTQKDHLRFVYRLRIRIERAL